MTIQKSLLYVGLIFASSQLYGQNKKEQLEQLKYTIDSLKSCLIVANKSHEDSILIERRKYEKLEELIYQQKGQIDQMLEKTKILQFQDSIQSNEMIDLKIKLKEMKFEKDSIDYSEKQFFTIYNDCSFSNYPNELYTEFIKDFKNRFFKYPENNFSYGFNVPSYSRLTEVEIWWQGDIAYLLLVVKDVKMIIESGNDAAPEISLTYYVFAHKNNKFEKDFQWQIKREICHQDSENRNINFQVTDINKDGIFEIWCVNENYCNGGINPNDLYIYMFQNGELFTMKSATNIPDFDITDETITEWNKDDEDPYLSINEFDSKFLSISTIYREHAIRMRNANILGKSLREIK